MSNHSGTDFQNKREYVRLETQIPIEIRMVPADERNDIQGGTGKNSSLPLPVPKPVEDPLLCEWLKHIDAKMDAIIKLIDIQTRNIPNLTLKALDISAGGMSFISTTQFSPGDVLEVKMLYPASMTQFLYLHGEVVQSQERSDGYFTALRFMPMDDAVRDKIIRLVFEKEREILRKKKEGIADTC
jgi:hypothetical protein